MSILNKPYPKRTEVRQKLALAFILGLFVFLFLFIFQPFGINLWKPDHKPLILLGYGFITSFVILFNAFILEKSFKNWFKEENWKVWKEIVWALWNILFIGTLNLLYSYWQTIFAISLFNFLNFQLITLLIGIFPVGIITMLNYNRLQRRNLSDAKIISHIIERDKASTEQIPKSEPIILMAENGKDKIVVEPFDLLLIASADNYVEVYYLKNEALHKDLLRNTIKNLSDSLCNVPDFIRCHRSFLVNLKRVIHVSGNSQGYKLHLANVEVLVPVSRSLNETIRKKITEIHTIYPK